MKKKLTNTFKTIKISAGDFRKRRLISKRVSADSQQLVWDFSPWRYIFVGLGLLAFLITREIASPAQNSLSIDAPVNPSASNALLLKSLSESEEAIVLAAKMAQQSHLSIAENVTWVAESNALRKEFTAQNAELVTARAVPVFDLTMVDRTIKYHTVAGGEGLQQIADKYGISTNTIKWANNMSDDSLEIGKQLRILPLDGIVYKIKAGDSFESLAEKYKSTVQRIQIFNDLEIGGLKVGHEIIIPEGILPTEERPGYVAPVVTTYYYNYRFSYGGGMSGDIINRSYGYPGPTPGNRYYFGNCTWYAYERRARIGRSIDTGGTWGHAYAWAGSARSRGFLVNNSPSVGAIIQTSSGGGGYGHVGVVEAIEANGDLIISDMNFAGYNVVTWRRISSSSVGGYNYIH